MDAIIAHQRPLTKQKREPALRQLSLNTIPSLLKGSTLLRLDLSGPLEDDFEGVVEQSIATAVWALRLVGKARSQASGHLGAGRRAIPAAYKHHVIGALPHRELGFPRSLRTADRAIQDIAWVAVTGLDQGHPVQRIAGGVLYFYEDVVLALVLARRQASR